MATTGHSTNPTTFRQGAANVSDYPPSDAIIPQSLFNPHGLNEPTFTILHG